MLMSATIPERFICRETPNICVGEVYRHPDVVEEQRKPLRQYSEKRDKSGVVLCPYSRPLGIGRFVPDNLCATTMKKSIRASLFKHHTLDLDIVNAQPSLLLRELKQSTIDPATYQWLNDYVCDRNNFILEKLKLCRLDGKNFMVRVVLFGQSVSSWLRDAKTQTTQATDYHYWIARQAKNLRELFMLWLSETQPDIEAKLRQAADTIWNKKVNYGDAPEDEEQSYEKRLLSKFSLYLQELEMREVWGVIEEFKAMGIDIVSYCYDGMLVDKKHEQKINDWLKAKENCEIKWIIKEWADGLHPDGFAVPFSAKTFAEKPTLQAKRTYFESHFSYIMELGLILMETPGSSKSFTLFTYNRAKEALLNLLYQKEDEKGRKTNKQFVDWWMRLPDRRQYDSMEFDPDGVAGPNVFNLFRGFPIERIQLQQDEQYNTALIHAHMLHLMEGSEEGYQYLLKYLAHLIQYPGRKPGVAILMTGPEGSGKSTFFHKLFSSLIGTLHILQTAQQEHIVGRFNQIGEKLVVMWEETSGRDSHTNANLIKTLITEERQMIEKKGKDGIEMKIPTRLFFFSNDSDSKPIKISESDRRFVAVRSDVPENKHEYFEKLFDVVMDCPFTMRRFFEELKTLDISDFNPARDRYIGQFYKELQRDCADVISMFWQYLCACSNDNEKRMYLSPLDEEGVDLQPLVNGEPIPCSEVYDWFAKWAGRVQRVDKEHLYGPRVFNRKLSVRYSAHVTKTKCKQRNTPLRDVFVFIFNDLPDIEMEE